MTTLSHTQPSLEARALAASLVVVGTVEEGPLSQLDWGTEPPQIHSTFRVAVEDALAGASPGPEVTVRVIGGQVDDRHTPWSSVMREGDRVLLFLTPYFAAERDEEAYVPYFRSCFPVSPDGVVGLDAQGLRDAYAQATERPETITVETIRLFVQAALQKRDQANARLPEREQVEQQAPPDRDPGMPVEPGGARWATLDGNGQEPRRPAT
jgi:hypothetical protein